MTLWEPKDLDLGVCGLGLGFIRFRVSGFRTLRYNPDGTGSRLLAASGVAQSVQRSIAEN